MKITFSHKTQEAANIESFFFSTEKKLDYTAGQYIELNLNHHKPDDRGTKRWFTLSSSPNDELLSITTKFALKPSSFKKALNKLEAGDELNINGPMGDFVLPKIIQTPLVFVAGGIGITPYSSIFKWLAETGEDRPIKFIYAVKNEEEIIFQDALSAADQHATIVVEEPSASWGGERGKLSAEIITGLTKPDDQTLVYVSGPEGLVEKLEEDLRRAGLAKHQLVTDFFPNYSDI
jgi:ferredoxin-NADP reductase